jgi:hypothetical protein
METVRSNKAELRKLELFQAQAQDMALSLPAFDDAANANATAIPIR